MPWRGGEASEGLRFCWSAPIGYPPAWLLEHVNYLGARGLPLVELCLEHDNVAVRRSALGVLEDMRSAATLPLLEKAAADGDETIRRRAREALEHADLYVLEETFRQWVSEWRGQPVGRLRPPDREGVRVAFRALSFVHRVGLAISVLVGLLLLAGWLRAFEPFKLSLVLQFLLVEGIVGDFFFFGAPSVYRWATAGRMVLLLGLLFLRDDDGRLVSSPWVRRRAASSSARP